MKIYLFKVDMKQKLQ